MNHLKEYKAAQAYVDKLAEFYRHLAVYLLVNAGLAIYNLAGGQTWFLYPLLGWGIGLAAHAANVFLLLKIDANWKSRKIEELVKKGNK